MSKMYFYNSEDDELCYDLPSIKSKMIDDEIKEKVVIVGERMPADGQFWCSVHLISGDSGDHGCGKGCREYEPRNKKSGCCRFRKNLYGATDETITVKLK